MQHPIFALMHGLPRMAEWCAELLNYTNMDQLYSLLNRQPALNADKRRVVNNPHWPQQLPEEAKLLLRRCQALMLNKALSMDRKKGRHSHDAHHNAAAAEPTLSLTLSGSGSSSGASGAGHGHSTHSSIDGYTTSATGSSGASASSIRAGDAAPNSDSFWLPVLASSSSSSGLAESSPLLPLPPGITPTVVPHSPNPSPSSSPSRLSHSSSDEAVLSSANTTGTSGSSGGSSSGTEGSAAYSSVLPPLPPIGSTVPLSSSALSSSSDSLPVPPSLSLSLPPPLPLPFSPSVGLLPSLSSPPPSSVSSVGRRSSSSSFTPLNATSVSFARREPPTNAP